jgi:hypothetical protein
MLTVENLRRVAEELLDEDGPEAFDRTAVNRYYYFCHLTVRELAEDQAMEGFRGDASDHRTAVRVLRTLGLDGLADNLQDLYDLRGDVDYDIGYSLGTGDIAFAEGLAERLPEKLEEQGLR